MWIVIIVYSGGVTNVYLQQNTFYKGCIYMASPIYVFSGDLLDYLFEQKNCHNGCIHMNFTPCLLYGG